MRPRGLSPRLKLEHPLSSVAMTNRVVTGLLNAALWGSGYLYSGRGPVGLLAVFTHLIRYFYTLTSLTVAGTWILWAPILILGSLFFAIDGYKYAGPGQPESREGAKSGPKAGVCTNCGSSMPRTAKFCPE